MNDLLTLMKTRRSCRNFSSQPVPQEKIDKIIEAGLYAASGRNMQTSIIIQVTNPALKEKLRQENCRIGGWQEDFDPFYNAPVILIVLDKKDCHTKVYDGSLVMGNMMLAAHELGLTTCWIHRAKEEFAGELGREILSSLGISEEYEGVAHCALGYNATEPAAVIPRREGRVFYIK